MTAAYTSDELRCGYRVIEVLKYSVLIECTTCGESFSAERDGDAAVYDCSICVQCGNILCPHCDAAKCEGCDLWHCTDHLTAVGKEKWCKVCLAEAGK